MGGVEISQGCFSFGLSRASKGLRVCKIGKFGSYRMGVVSFEYSIVVHSKVVVCVFRGVAARGDIFNTQSSS